MDELWQWYEEVGSVEADPSWGEMWDTSRALASLVAGGDEGLPAVDSKLPTTRGKRIAEVGAGLGLVGLSAVRTDG